MNLFKKIILCSLVILLCGCEEKLTYEYLLENPKVLKRKYDQCEENKGSNCGLVRHAADDFLSLVNVRRDNPEQFGLLILQAEQQLVSAKPEEYASRLHKVKTLLAVVAETSIE